MDRASRICPLDSDWLRAHPLPVPDNGTDKNGRGRVLAIGGSRTVPGGIMLTVEAALRAGAGKVQIATIESAALALGIAMPEVAVFGLPETAAGEIASRSVARLAELVAKCDTVVAGPAMSDASAASRIVAKLVKQSEVNLVLDASALMQLDPYAKALRALARPPVLTPHIGEMAALLGRSAESIEADRIQAVRDAAEHFGAVCVLKGATTLVAGPDGELFAYAGGGVGLATGGSGDVLAGLVGGLCSRGATPLQGVLWAVWLHGEAGRRCAEQLGSLGFLARELLDHVPRLMTGV